MGSNLKKKSPDPDWVEFQSLIRLFKQIIKKRGLSYKDMARRLGLSESGLKKIFYGQDCSFRRLSQIAKALDCRLLDLMDQIDREKTTSVRFSKPQQSYFLKNRLSFNFFVKLVIERRSLDQIKIDLNIDNRKTFSILKKLDDLHLIRLQKGEKVKLPPLEQVIDFGTGPLLETIYQEWGANIVRDLAHPRFQQTGQFVVRSLSVRPETYNELLDRLRDLDREFLRRSIREMSALSSELTPIRWMSLVDSTSFTQTQNKVRTGG